LQKGHQFGVLLVLIGATLWGSSSNSLEYLMNRQHLAWQTVLLIRMIITAICFFGITLFRKENLLAPVREQPKLMLQFTVLGMYCMQVPFTLAIHYSNAATGTVLQYLMPAILLGYYLWKERRAPRRRELLAAVLAVLGTTLIATQGRGAVLAVSKEALFWGIVSAFGMAFYTAFAAALLKTYSCFAVIGWGSLGNAILLLLLNHPTFAGAVWDIHTLAAFAVVIVFGTLIAYSVYLESTKYIPASETGALAAFEPLSAYAISILFMGNHVGTAEMAGAACIMIMVWMLSRK
jgi:drug/metabolite transporter (DMT)-like permease